MPHPWEETGHKVIETNSGIFVCKLCDMKATSETKLSFYDCDTDRFDDES